MPHYQLLSIGQSGFAPAIVSAVCVGGPSLHVNNASFASARFMQAAFADAGATPAQFDFAFRELNEGRGFILEVDEDVARRFAATYPETI